MTENMRNDRPGITRRSLVISAGLMSSLGLFGCSKRRGNSSTPEIMTEDEEWQSAYDEAVKCWKTLQKDISKAKDYRAELEGQRLKDPDALAALQEALDSANRLEDEVSDLSVPKGSEEIESGIEKLKKISKSYRNASYAIADAKDAIEVIKPGQGAFDFMDVDGYSYHIEYDINPDITIDSSEGKPGFVGLNFDFSDSTVAVTNTTSGKKAPGLLFCLIPLYASSDFGLDGGNCGPLSVPFNFDSEGRVPFDADTSIQPLYVNPFDYGEYSANDLPWGNKIFGYFGAGILVDSYGQEELYIGGKFEAGESRTLACAACDQTFNVNNNTHVADVLSESAETFKNPVAWCVWPWVSSPNGVQGTAVFNAACRGDQYLTYNPIA